MFSKSNTLFCGIFFAMVVPLFAQTIDLPAIFVDTKGKCLDMNVTEKIPATMRVLDGATNNIADSAKGTLYDIGIKVRGQSSATFPKPGYTIEVGRGENPLPISQLPGIYRRNLGILVLALNA